MTISSSRMLVLYEVI